MIETYRKAISAFNELMGTDYSIENPELIAINKKNGVAKKNEVIQRLHSRSTPVSRFSQISHISAEAILGMDGDRVSGKAAILYREDVPFDILPEAVLVHELGHIFAQKREYNGYFFEDTVPDGDVELYSGYALWKEFVADYFSNRICGCWPSSLKQMKLTKSDRKKLISRDRTTHAFVSSYFALVACTEEFRTSSEDLDGILEQSRVPFPNVFRLLGPQMKKESFWEISPDFIQELGCQYIVDKTTLILDMSLESLLLSK